MFCRVQAKKIVRMQSVCCIAPTGTDKLVLLRCSETYPATKDAIKFGWPPGIQSERPMETVCGESLIELKLKGISMYHK